MMASTFQVACGANERMASTSQGVRGAKEIITLALQVARGSKDTMASMNPRKMEVHLVGVDENWHTSH